MAGPDRQAPDTVGATIAAALRAQPRAFTLFAALRALEALYPDQPRLGESVRPGEERVRLSQPPFLIFAPTEVAGIEAGPRWQVEQFVFGLFGPQGALPLHLTELAADRARHFDDPTLRDFINTLQHRLIALFYRAWAGAEPVVQADRIEGDEFLAALCALTGLDAAGGRRRDRVQDGAKASRAGLFVAGARSADALETLLRDYFGIPIVVRSYVGRWLDIPADAYLRLGGRREHALLGAGATAGAATWQASHSFELVMGPVDGEGLRRFLPGTPALEQLRDLTRLYTNDEWQWQLRILVKRESARGVTLGSGARVGWTSWLGGKSAVADEVVLQGDALRAAA